MEWKSDGQKQGECKWGLWGWGGGEVVWCWLPPPRTQTETPDNSRTQDRRRRVEWQQGVGICGRCDVGRSDVSSQAETVVNNVLLFTF